MPPHCDALDGPVVKAAIKALEAGDVRLVLPYVSGDDEPEVVRAFEMVLPVRKTGDAAARQVADLYFFETVVRVHRAGEGAYFTGLKPAGLNVGPVIPVAEQAIDTDTSEELERLLHDIVSRELKGRFRHMQHLRATAERSVKDAREYVHAMLGLQVWAHGLYQQATATSHESKDEHHNVGSISEQQVGGNDGTRAEHRRA